MDGMKDFPTEFTRPFFVSFNYLRKCKIGYFDNDVPFWQKYWRFIIKTVLAFLNLISMWMYLFSVFGSQMNIADIAFMATSCLIALQSVLKATVLFPKKKEIENLIRGLARMWKTENLNNIQTKQKNRRLKQMNVGLKVFYWASRASVVLNLGPQLIYTVVGKIRQQDFEFILPFGYVYPFDPVRNWGRYLVVYFFQCYSFVHLTDYYLGAQCLSITLCLQLSTEFALLREDIKNAIPTANKNIITQETKYVSKNMRIESMVKNHQELIKLAELLNYIFNQMVFIDLCFFAVILCFFAISISVSHDVMDRITHITSLLTVLALVYIVCYYGEMLKEESAAIAESAYENPWYKGGTHYQKTIALVIMRAQHPCHVTSLNYAPISLNTFTKVVSSTWSYFSLAMTIVQK
ncbi:odorant receptor 4-like [Maniola jurtina]|uniref:odorant receptor 4-like n=1 Tax=Maniola jurtina TaxID=191418 RepID=UPI001E68EAE3|nr:odorant receptor 4-like [Maniola jurtina]